LFVARALFKEMFGILLRLQQSLLRET